MSAIKTQTGPSSLLLFIKNVQNRHGFACGLGVNALHIFRKIQKPAKTLEFCHFRTRAILKILPMIMTVWRPTFVFVYLFEAT